MVSENPTPAPLPSDALVVDLSKPLERRAEPKRSNKQQNGQMSKSP